MGLALMLTLQNGSHGWNARIAGSAGLLSIDELFPEPARRPQPQIHVFGQLRGALARTFAQISFGARLQAPGDPPKQVLMV